MTLAAVRAKTSGAAGPFRLTVEQYHRMIRQGILREGEPVELLDGQLERKNRSAAGEDPMTVSTAHATVVGKVDDLNPRFKRLACHIRIQQPITLPPYDEPGPDAAIICGAIGDYTHRHRTAKDVLCVIEVADSSLRDDRTRKQRTYANGGIPAYVILNIPDRGVEVYSQPLPGKGRYGRSITLSAKQRLTFPAPQGKQINIPVRRLLP